MFTQVPVIRGIYEITWLLDLLQDFPAHVCGGYARYCASPRAKPIEANAVDIYCETVEVFDTLRLKFQELGFREKFASGVAITYHRAKSGKVGAAHGPIQLIKPIDQGAIKTSGSVENILSNFDFTVIRILINKDRLTCTADEDFLNDEGYMFLRIKNIHCPVSSSMRFMKYYQKGYKTKLVQILKLFADWEARTPEYKAKLVNAIASLEADTMEPEDIQALYDLMTIDYGEKNEMPVLW
jgi:hypothetical protein